MTDQKTNAERANCDDCNGIVEPGEGLVWWESGPDDGGDVVGRTPAGWRTTHKVRTVCATVRTSRDAHRTAEREAAREKAEAAAKLFEVRRDALRADIEALVAQYGLIKVPRDHCRLTKAVSEADIYPRHSVYPEDGGASTEWFGQVVQRPDGIVAWFGHVGGPSMWASPALVTAGLQQYRLCQWWVPGVYAAKDYPGPAVPDAELTDEERVKVAGLRTEARKAQRWEEVRMLTAEIPFALKPILTPGATWVLSPVDVAALDAYIDARKSGNAAVLTVSVKVTHPQLRQRRRRSPRNRILIWHARRSTPPSPYRRTSWNSTANTLPACPPCPRLPPKACGRPLGALAWTRPVRPRLPRLRRPRRRDGARWSASNHLGTGP